VGVYYGIYTGSYNVSNTSYMFCAFYRKYCQTIFEQSLFLLLSYMYPDEKYNLISCNKGIENQLFSEAKSKKHHSYLLEWKQNKNRIRTNKNKIKIP
jgi:hypothetical protein